MKKHAIDTNQAKSVRNGSLILTSGGFTATVTAIYRLIHINGRPFACRLFWTDSGCLSPEDWMMSKHVITALEYKVLVY